MGKSLNVVVYVRADDVRLLESQGKETREWVRGLVRHALDRLAEREGIIAPAKIEEATSE